MKTVICRIDLGLTRIAGYTLYNEVTREFEETTPKEVKYLINRKEVNGLCLNGDEIVLDTEAFNMNNLMIKSGVGKFRMLYDTNKIVNCMYAVVRVIETDKEKQFEIISSKYGRVKVTSERLRILIETAHVAGVKIVNNKIQVCKGVTIEDRRIKNKHFNKDLDASGALAGESAGIKNNLALNDADNIISIEKSDGLKLADGNVDVPKADENKNISKQRNNNKQ